MLHIGVRATYEHPHVVMLQQHLLRLVGCFHETLNEGISQGRDYSDKLTKKIVCLGLATL